MVTISREALGRRPAALGTLALAAYAALEIFARARIDVKRQCHDDVIIVGNRHRDVIIVK